MKLGSKDKLLDLGCGVNLSNDFIMKGEKVGIGVRK